MRRGDRRKSLIAKFRLLLFLNDLCISFYDESGLMLAEWGSA
jgi:hypothetical protein